jgi:TonB family protein
MTVDNPIHNSKERRLLYSGLAAGALHMLIAAVALCFAVQGIQKTSRMLIIDLVEGGLNEVPVSAAAQQRAEVSAAAPSKKVKAAERLSGLAPEVQSVQESKPSSVVSIRSAQSEPRQSGISSAAVSATPGRGEAHTVYFGSSAGPHFLKREIPEYPFMAKRMNKEGKVLLKLTIDEKGRLLNVEVVEAAEFGFTEAALEAVRKSTYRPAVRNGKAVFSKALLPVRFRMAGQ